MRNHYQPIAGLMDKDKPEQIEARIKVLIHLYLAKQSGLIATMVNYHINALLAHPDFIAGVDQRCAFVRLAAHWRCIAWINKE